MPGKRLRSATYDPARGTASHGESHRRRLLLTFSEAAVTARLNIEIVERAKGLILVLRGELDLSTAPLLEDELTRAKATAAPTIVVDLDELEFIDSSGLHVLIEHARPTLGRQRVRLTRGSPQVQRLFEISGMLDHLPFED
jgi:anti-sigma B factor antagonist